jgi:hypothetical protein
MPSFNKASKASASAMAEGNPAYIAAIQRSRSMLNKRALVAGFAGAVPVPGLDWAVDAALLSRLLPKINAEFGLSAEQLDRLDPKPCLWWARFLWASSSPKIWCSKPPK